MVAPRRDIRHSAARRLFAGAAVVVFLGVFFALPLHAAMSLCAMPCCGHSDGTPAVVDAGSMPCATECTVGAEQAMADPKPAIAPVKRAGDRVTLLAATPVAAIESHAVPDPADRGAMPPHHRAADASLLVLNSVFRI